MQHHRTPPPPSPVTAQLLGLQTLAGTVPPRRPRLVPAVRRAAAALAGMTGRMKVTLAAARAVPAGGTEAPQPARR